MQRQQKPIPQRPFLRLQTATLVAFCLSAVTAQDAPFSGDPACPCLLGSDDGLPQINPIDMTDQLLTQLGDINITNYGIGCGRHDMQTSQCTTDECITQSILPEPVDCDRSWCDRSFCWVNPINCSLLNRRSTFFAHSGRYYSYATCRDMDSFSQQPLLSSLSGKTLRVGFNSNSGGWKGAYSSTSQHFEGPRSKWSGPAVDFITAAAQAGGFRVVVQEPPEFLRNKSVDFFSPSMFDYCVYATSLGYLDMCVADYTVTETRAASTDWLLLGTEPLFLVVQTDAGGQSTWDKYMGNVATIFQPFTVGTWLFMICVVIPILGFFMVIHEYNHSGTVFPRSEAIMVGEQGSYQVQNHRIPLYQHVVKSVYITLLSVLHQSYETSVVTYGAKLNLLGIAFFVLTIIAVYTANLAAILGQRDVVTSVNSLEDALSRGYRICGERKNIEDLPFIYGMDSDVFVVDPVEQGGDGMAGFNCANCKSRIRVFDFLDMQNAEQDERYCHAAIAPLQDLEVLQADGDHCNKTYVGTPIRYVQSGMPVTEQLSRAVIALFLKLKNDGIYDRELFASHPESRCRVDEGGEGSALSVAQLMGIWVVTFGFATLGLVVTCFRPCWMKKCANTKVHKIRRHNQWGDTIHSSTSSEKISLVASHLATPKNDTDGHCDTAENSRSEFNDEPQPDSTNARVEDWTENGLSMNDVRHEYDA